MDEKVFKRVLDEALTPLRGDIKSLKEDVSTLKKDVNILKGSVLSIEQTMTSYSDRYEINQHNIERVDTRLSTVEGTLDIEPPEDLKVPHFSAN